MPGLSEDDTQQPAAPPGREQTPPSAPQPQQGADDAGRGQSLDEGSLEALSQMSPQQLRAQVSAGRLSREDLHAVVRRQSQKAQEAGDKRDNGVGVVKDFTTRLLAKDSELMNRAAQKVAHWTGAKSAEKSFQQNADVMRDIGSGKSGDTNPAKDSLSAAGQWLGKPLVNIPVPGANFMKKHPYLGGIAAGGVKFVSGFISPENILMMAATGGLGAMTRKLVDMGFTVMNAKQIVEQSSELLKEKDPEKRAEMATGLLLLLGMAGWSHGGKDIPPGEGERMPGKGAAGGEGPQMQAGVPQLPAKGGGAVEQSASLPAKQPPTATGMEVKATTPDFLKNNPAGNEEPALVPAGGDEESGTPKSSGGGGPSSGPSGSGKPPNRRPSKPNATPPEGGKGGGSGPSKEPGGKPEVSDFLKKPETPEQAAAREKLAQLMEKPGTVSADEAAKLAMADPNSTAYKAVKTWAKDSDKINENPNSPQAQLMMELMQKVEPYKGGIVYRGLHFNNEAEMRAFLTDIASTGKYVNRDPFMSTSKNVPTSRRFAGAAPYGLTMEIRENHSGRDFEPFANELKVYEHQEEVLFLKGSEFRLIRAVMQNGKPHLILEEKP
jgi:hypothetical protein